MHVRRFLVYALLCHFSGGTSDDNVDSLKIQATAGETVTLPCKISVTDDELPTLEWLKEDHNRSIAFLYRGHEIHEMKALIFWYRTNLFMNELKNGNISLRLSNVQLSDAGRYTCMTRDGEKDQKVNALQLTVVAVSEPKLSVVPAEGDGVTVQCESNCWFPKPEIEFLDDQEKVVSAEESKSSGPDTRGCFSVTRNFTMQTYTKRIICRVQHQHIRVAEIYIPPCVQDNCMGSSTVITVIVALVFIIGVLTSILVYKKCRNSVQSGTVVTAEGNRQKSLDDNIANKRHEEDEVNRLLPEELNDLKSKQMS